MNRPILRSDWRFQIESFWITLDATLRVWLIEFYVTNRLPSQCKGLKRWQEFKWSRWSANCFCVHLNSISRLSMVKLIAEFPWRRKSGIFNSTVQFHCHFQFHRFNTISIISIPSATEVRFLNGESFGSAGQSSSVNFCQCFKRIERSSGWENVLFLGFQRVVKSKRKFLKYQRLLKTA